ncbi:MAG TPA: hypothetical protein VKP61_08510, partial [Candidatus Acidoferrum sp.]|nr:hypothetical protein [Candidatus Acidoferrum sp.]
MPNDGELKANDTARRRQEAASKKAARRSLAGALRAVGGRLRRTLFATRGAWLLGLLFLAAATISAGFADTATERMILPIEVLSVDGPTSSRTVELRAGE